MAIYKKVLDENGQEMNAEQIKDKFDQNLFFYFRTVVTDDSGKELYNSIDKVQAGTSLTIGPFNWKNLQKPPHYKVEELVPSEDSGWVFKGIKNESGNLKDSDTCEVIATNQTTQKSGQLEILKTVANTGGAAELLKFDREFKFKVTVTRKSDGFELGQNEVTINMPAGEVEANSKLTEVFKWYGEDPDYTVEEISQTFSKPANMSNEELKNILEELGINNPSSMTNQELTDILKSLGFQKPDSMSNQELKSRLENLGFIKLVSMSNEELKITLKSIGLIEIATSENDRDFSSILLGALLKDLKYEQVSIQHGTGTLKAGSNNEPIKVNAYNYMEGNISNLIIKKELKAGQSTNDTFYFNVEINGVANKPDGKLVLLGLSAKANEAVKGIDPIVWANPNVAPTYKITEVDENGNPVDPSMIQSIEAIQNNVTQNRVTGNNTITGSLTNSGTTNVTEVKFTNSLKQKSGKIKITKKAETSSKVNPKHVEFNISIVVKGEFTYKNEQYKKGKELVINKKIKGGESFETDDIIWYGSEAPTYTVEEVNIPLGWQLIGRSEERRVGK